MRQPADHDAWHVLGRRGADWHTHGDVLGTLVGVFVIAMAVQGLTLAGIADRLQYVPLRGDPGRRRRRQFDRQASAQPRLTPGRPAGGAIE